MKRLLYLLICATAMTFASCSDDSDDKKDDSKPNDKPIETCSLSCDSDTVCATIDGDEACHIVCTSDTVICEDKADGSAVLTYACIATDDPTVKVLADIPSNEQKCSDNVKCNSNKTQCGTITDTPSEGGDPAETTCSLQCGSDICAILNGEQKCATECSEDKTICSENGGLASVETYRCTTTDDGKHKVYIVSSADCEAGQVCNSNKTACEKPSTPSLNSLEQAIARGGKLAETISTSGDTPAAVTISDAGLAAIIEASGWEHDAQNVGPVSFSVTGCAEKNTRSAYSGDLSSCVLMTVPWSFMGANLTVYLGLPIHIESTETEHTIVLDMEQGELLEILDNGAPAKSFTAWKSSFQALFGEYLSKINLVQINTWNMVGDQKIKFKLGSTKINDTNKTLTVGIYTNLEYGVRGSVNWSYDEAMPNNALVALHVHPDLMRALQAYKQAELAKTPAYSSEITLDNQSYAVSLIDFSSIYNAENLSKLMKDYDTYVHFGYAMWSNNQTNDFDYLSGIMLSVKDKKVTASVGNLGNGNKYTTATYPNILAAFAPMTKYTNEAADLTAAVLNDTLQFPNAPAQVGISSTTIRTDLSGVSVYYK